MKNCRIALVTTPHAKEIAGKISTLFNHSCEVFEKDGLVTVRHMIRNTPVRSVILVMKEGLNGHEPEIRQFTEDFPSLPLIAIIPNDLELARKCGEIGIWRTVDMDNLSLLKEELMQLQSERQITLVESGILPDIQDSSVLLQKALRIMEEEYINIQQVKQVAEQLGVDECTLVREFKKYEIDSPKNILTGIKTYHASILMNNKGLSIKEIARLSGFTNERQYQRTIKKKHDVTPVGYRDKILGRIKVFISGALNLEVFEMFT